MTTSIILSLLIVLQLAAVCFGVYTIYANMSAAPYLPTGKKHVRTMLAFAELKKGETLMDLGSGDGRIVCMAAAQADITSIGIEINPLLLLWSQAKRLLSPAKSRITFRRENLWDVDLSDVDVLTLFFIKGKMKKLEQKIIKEMKPGSRVISHHFTFEGWQPEKKHGSITFNTV